MIILEQSSPVADGSEQLASVPFQVDDFRAACVMALAIVEAGFVRLCPALACCRDEKKQRWQQLKHTDRH